MDIAQVLFGGLSMTGLFTGLVLLYKARAEKRQIESIAEKNGVDAAAIVSSTAIGLLLPMREQLSVMRDTLRDANSEITLARTRIHELEIVVHELTLEVQRYRATAQKEL